MKWYCLPIAVVVAGMLSGCQAKNTHKPDTPSPADDKTEQIIRNQFQQQDANTRIGRVIAIIPQYTLAAVRNVDVREFNVGDCVSFIDANCNVVANGEIVSKTADLLHIRYDGFVTTGCLCVLNKK